MIAKREKFIFIVLFVLFAIQLQAVNYYVNANHVNADDNNVGTNPEAPWRTLNIGKLVDRGNDIIYVAAGNYYITSFYLIRGDVTIIGSSKDEVFILGVDDEAFFDISSPHTGKFFDTWNNLNFTVKNVTVKNMRNIDNSNGNLTDRGVFNVDANAKLTLENVNIKNAIAERNAIIRAWGPVVLKDVTIENSSLNNVGDRNFALIGVNAIPNQTSQLTMEKVRINDCNSSGGSIVTIDQPEGGDNRLTTINITNCSFENNFYLGWGSCLRVNNLEPGKVTFRVSNSFFRGNQGELVGTVFIEGDRSQADNTCELELLFQNNIFLENYTSDVNGTSVFGISGRDNSWTKGSLSFINNTMFNNGKNEIEKEAWTFHYIQKPNATFNFINNIAINQINKTLIFENHPTTSSGVGIIEGNLINDVGGGASNFIEKFNNETLKNEFINADQLKFEDLVYPEDGSVPYLPVIATSYNIDKGVSNDLVPTLDICGKGIYNEMKDVGAYEYHPNISTGLSEKIVDLKTYPNPFVDYIEFSEKALEVEVFTLNGERVILKTMTSQIDTSDLKEGVYFIRVVSEYGRTSTIKMLK